MEVNDNMDDNIIGSISLGEPLIFKSYPNLEQCLRIIDNYEAGTNEFNTALQFYDQLSNKDKKQYTPAHNKEIILNLMQECSRQSDIKSYRRLREQLKKY